MPPQTEFQKYIRLSKHEIMSCSSTGVTETEEPVLSDHRPCQLNEDDYLLVYLVPHKKGANFRDLPGVIVGADNVARRDTNEPKVLPNGKPMEVMSSSRGNSFCRNVSFRIVPSILSMESLKGHLQDCGGMKR